MTDLLEQMKTRAEQAQTAYEAYKAECEKVEELPEVWYLHTDGDCGVSYSAGSTSARDNWCGTLTGITNHCRGYTDSSSFFRKCTAAEYNNARALYHGADFTGRLHEIDRPVCELNKATRDEMGACERRDIEFFSVADDRWVNCGYWKPFSLLDGTTDDDIIYRLRAPKKRPMTVKQCLQFQSHNGDAIRYRGGKAHPPQLMSAEVLAAGSCERAPITTLNDDGTGGEWVAFEVQA